MKKIIFTILLILAAETACSQVESPVPITDDTTAPPQITSFEECVAAGNAILRSLPAKCVTAEGVMFVEDQAGGDKGSPTQEENSGGVKDSICQDQCGNGTCQQIVCFGSGCPCAETPSTCPKDCAVVDDSHWK